MASDTRVALPPPRSLENQFVVLTSGRRDLIYSIHSTREVLHTYIMSSRKQNVNGEGGGGCLVWRWHAFEKNS